MRLSLLAPGADGAASPEKQLFSVVDFMTSSQMAAGGVACFSLSTTSCGSCPSGLVPTIPGFVRDWQHLASLGAQQRSQAGHLPPLPPLPGDGLCSLWDSAEFGWRLRCTLHSVTAGLSSEPEMPVSCSVL